MKKTRALLALFLAVIIIITVALPVFADQADPDDPPTVESISIYRNLLETGDFFAIVKANIPYASTPNATAQEAFIWQLLATDNTTVLGQTTVYDYSDSGYGWNVFGFYFDAADAPTWNQLYTLRLVGSPAIFDTPPYYYYPIALSNYSSITSSEAAKIALSSEILTLAASLDIHWGLTSTTSLLYESETGTVLSIYGEAFFRGAIFGVQALAPYAFRMVVTDIDADDRTWSTGFSENLTEIYDGTWIAAAKAGGADIWGTTYDLSSIIIMILLCIGILILNLMLTHDNWNAAVDIAIIFATAPRIDLLPLSFTALICSIFILYEGTKVKSFIR